MEQDAEVKAGQDWVVTRLGELAHERGVKVEGIAWGNAEFDVPHAGVGGATETTYSMVVFVGGERKVDHFTEDGLADCGVGDTNVRRHAEGRLRELLGGRRIGF